MHVKKDSLGLWKPDFKEKREINLDDYDAIDSRPEPSQPLLHTPMRFKPRKKEGEDYLRVFVGFLAFSEYQEGDYGDCNDYGYC